MGRAPAPQPRKYPPSLRRRRTSPTPWTTSPSVAECAGPGCGVGPLRRLGGPEEVTHDPSPFAAPCGIDSDVRGRGGFRGLGPDTRVLFARLDKGDSIPTGPPSGDGGTPGRDTHVGYRGDGQGVYVRWTGTPSDTGPRVWEGSSPFDSVHTRSDLVVVVPRAHEALAKSPVGGVVRGGLSERPRTRPLVAVRGQEPRQLVKDGSSETVRGGCIRS